MLLHNEDRKLNMLESTPLTMWFVYVLLCEDGSLYTGYSNDVEKRFLSHKNGKGGHYTRSHKPIKLIYSERLATQTQALAREREIKGWSRDKKIRTLKLNLAI